VPYPLGTSCFSFSKGSELTKLNTLLLFFDRDIFYCSVSVLGSTIPLASEHVQKKIKGTLAHPEAISEMLLDMISWNKPYSDAGNQGL